MLSSNRRAPCCLTTPKRTSLEGLPPAVQLALQRSAKRRPGRAVRVEGSAPTNRSCLILVKSKSASGSYGYFKGYAWLANLHTSMPLTV